MKVTKEWSCPQGQVGSLTKVLERKATRNPLNKVLPGGNLGESGIPPQTEGSPYVWCDPVSLRPKLP